MKRVLCVDSHADSCELVATVLGWENYEVAVCRTAAGGWERACSERFDLYLIDTRLDDALGLELARRLRALGAGTPLVFHSAEAFPGDIEQGIGAGARAYITKPRDPEQLLATVRHLVADGDGCQGGI